MLQIPNKKWVNANNAQNIPGTKKKFNWNNYFELFDINFRGFFLVFFFGDHSTIMS